MKRLLTLILFAMLFSGCGDKHVIRVDRLLEMGKINVLYVAVGDVYTLAIEDGSTSLSRLVRGGAYYSIDLKAAKVATNEGTEGVSYEISLPTPAVEPFPDPTRSIEFKPKVRIGYTDAGLNKIREKYDQIDREKIEKAVKGNPEYMKMAKEQAESILRSILPGQTFSIKWLE